MVVSCWPASVSAEVSLVATSPPWPWPVREKVRPARPVAGVSAKKFAQRTKNGPKSAFYGVLGELFRGSATGSPVLGELFRGSATGSPVLGELRRICGPRRDYGLVRNTQADACRVKPVMSLSVRIICFRGALGASARCPARPRRPRALQPGPLGPPTSPPPRTLAAPGVQARSVGPIRPRRRLLRPERIGLKARDLALHSVVVSAKILVSTPTWRVIRPSVR